MPARTVVYSALGSLLEVFDLDVDTGALTRIQALPFARVIQYAWANAARTRLYILISGAGPMAKVKVPDHYVQVFDILSSGELAPHQPPVRLNNRPLNVSLDRTEEYLLIAYNKPAEVTVHKIAPDGSIGEEIKQPPMDYGVTAHQVRVTPHGNIAVVPACAHDPTGETPGSVTIFTYTDGHLAPLARMTADPERAARWRGVKNGGQGFAARHVDFHPVQPWMYLVVETQSELRLYDYDETGVTLKPRFIASMLEGAPPPRSAQWAAAVHVHPNGRFVYTSNRAWDTELVDGEKVFVGGLNEITAFAIDQRTGEPKLIQHAHTLGLFPRTFGLDASGRVLVAGNQEPATFRDGDRLRRTKPGLVVFRIGDDGRLTVLNTHDHNPQNGETCFWMGVVSLQDRG